MRQHRVAILSLALATASGCGTGLPGPVALPQPGIRPATHIDQIHDYQGAVAAIAAVFERELGVGAFPVTFHFSRTVAEFESALVEFGQDPLMARDTAEVMRAVGMRGRVLLNHDALDRINWRNRVRVLAHELVHSLQYELAGGLRGTSEQWLREGFAEWAALMVVDRLRGRPLSALRGQQLALFRRSDRSKAPRLEEMVDFQQWVALANRRDIAPYSQAFLAADLLVERHGAPAVIEYFRQFATETNRFAAFRTAFGEHRDVFEAALEERLGIRRRWN